ncbi:DUF1254 domain-containing protein [Comamonas serinivorans]|uniref:DUF1254 domain-containing protein n=1 Tax=Comamonas serinivorans TaxID=1082851 RepID=UPI0026D0437B
MSSPANTAPLAIDQALVYTWPLYEMRRMRAATSPLRVADAGAAPEGQRWCNVFTHARKLLRAGESRVVTPNNDTLYTNAWLDLSAGPLVLQVPDTAGRYYVLGFLDFFTNPFAHVGQRLTGTAARRFFVTGPGWQGEVPAEFRAPGAHIQSPTDWVWIIGRIYVNGNDDIPHVNALQDGFALTLPDGRPARRPFTPGIDPKAPATGQQVLTQVNAALADNPPPPEDAALLAPWAALGVAAGAAPTPAQCAGVDEALPRVLALLRQAGDASADANAAPTDGAGGAWSSMPLVQGSFGRNHLLRARVALQYIGMLESAEAMYPMSRRDGGGGR